MYFSPYYDSIKTKIRCLMSQENPQKKATALSAVQIDVENTERFDIQYVDKDGKLKHPFLLHA